MKEQENQRKDTDREKIKGNWHEETVSTVRGSSEASCVLAARLFFMAHIIP